MSLEAQLDRAEAFFVSAEDGEDRENMAAFWVAVARAAVAGPDRLAALLDAHYAVRTAAAGADDAALDAALDALAAFDA